MATTSRYANLPVLTRIDATGRMTSYFSRRMLPQGNDMPLLVGVTVTQGDRLDLIAARTLGDPEQYWRICDANNALDPFDLTATLGRVLRIAVPQF
ncbi:LysM domain-containing protein [Variovorax humicola]|uniref:LysM domain-containing protein n=1 Tax=Variovorax humicola TaxID=1769758 RepID=A0ABU8VWX2_9BURK